MQIIVEAEQFLPNEGKIPHGVRSDGRGAVGSAKNAYVINTTAGASYLNEGDYVVHVNNEVAVIKKDVFEAHYKEITEG